VQGFTDGAKYEPSSGVVEKLGVETPAQLLWVVPHVQ
jgi:hypothetical protein